LHSIPASQARIAGYRIGKDQSGGTGTILQSVSSPMSASGQKQTFAKRRHESALPPISGHRRDGHVRLVPKAAVSSCNKMRYKG
jgi:hypothetical protein